MWVIDIAQADLGLIVVNWRTAFDTFDRMLPVVDVIDMQLLADCGVQMQRFRHTSHGLLVRTFRSSVGLQSEDQGPWTGLPL